LEHGVDKKYRVKQRVLALLLIACVIAMINSGQHIYREIRGTKEPQDVERAIEKYRRILTKEEVSKWKKMSVQSGKAYVEVNTRVEVDKNGKADIRLVNPPYSDFVLKIEIVVEVDATKTKTLYTSDFIEPGTVVETVELEEILPTEEQEAKVIYSFYNREEEKQADYEQKIMLKFQI
jgi:hypothetical protein